MTETPRPNEAQPGAAAPPVTLSDRAARRIAIVLAREQGPDMKLRVSVSGGGCFGFQYAFSLDQAKNDDDLVIERDGATVVIDELSFNFLAGSEIDFTEDLSGQFFTVHNPNAASSCSCGSSFSVV